MVARKSLLPLSTRESPKTKKARGCWAETEARKVIIIREKQMRKEVAIEWDSEYEDGKEKGGIYNVEIRVSK